MLDRFALQDHPLHTVNRTVEAARSKAQSQSLSNSQADGALRVFYLVKDAIAETYIIDHEQNLTIAELPFEGTRSFILPMTRFIEHSVLRQHTQSMHSLASIEFYILHKTNTGFSATTVPTESNISANYLPIKAVGTQGIVGNIEWTIYCDDQTFSSQSHGDQLFVELAKSIQTHRQSSEQQYRCYITDIEVTSMFGDRSCLAMDLEHKLALEEQLNQAFANLPR